MAGLRTPLSLDDLRAITTALEHFESQLVTADGDYTDLGALVLRVEIGRPESDDVIGHFTLQDGWVGFMPLGAERA